MSAFDRLDMALIGYLQRDGRTSLTELADRLRVSHGTMRNRLGRLRAEGVVKLTAVVDPAKVGFPTQVILGIDGDLNHLKDVERQLADLEEAYFVATMAGRIDFIVAAAFASDEHLRDFLLTKLSKIKGIRDTETFHILHMSKRTWQWRVPEAGVPGD